VRIRGLCTVRSSEKRPVCLVQGDHGKTCVIFQGFSDIQGCDTLVGMVPETSNKTTTPLPVVRLMAYTRAAMSEPFVDLATCDSVGGMFGMHVSTVSDINAVMLRDATENASSCPAVPAYPLGVTAPLVRPGGPSMPSAQLQRAARPRPSS
jgi:hypothetical protein